jgi:hypothetical protein
VTARNVQRQRPAAESDIAPRPPLKAEVEDLVPVSPRRALAPRAPQTPAAPTAPTARPVVTRSRCACTTRRTSRRGSRYGSS